MPQAAWPRQAHCLVLSCCPVTNKPYPVSPSCRRAFGQLRKRHGDAFAVRTDVLAFLTFVVERTARTFAVQGLSISAVGCANLGPALRADSAPLMRLLIQESLRRFRQFNMQVGAGAGCRGAGCLLGVERRCSHPVTEQAACMRMHTIPTTLHRAACPQALPTHSTLAPALLFAGNGQPGISHFSHGAADCGGCGHADAAAGL